MGGYKTEIIQIPDLQESKLQAMCQIYLAHYDSSDQSLFRSDLEGKSEALLIFKNHELVGFTLCKHYREIWRKRPIQIIYSGDTVIDRAHWGQQALAFSWITRAGQIKRLEPDIPLYWFLIVKGHRTYRYLPTFSRSFHPHWAVQHNDLKQLADWHRLWP